MGLVKENDECLILHCEIMKYIHLACSEAFDVQLQDRNLLTGCPDRGTSPRPEKGIFRVALAKFQGVRGYPSRLAGSVSV